MVFLISPHPSVTLYCGEAAPVAGATENLRLVLVSLCGITRVPMTEVPPQEVGVKVPVKLPLSIATDPGDPKLFPMI